MKSIVSFFTKHSTRRTAAFFAVALVLVNIGLLIPSHYVQAANLFTDPIGTIGDALKGAIVQFFFGYLTSLLLAIITTVLVIISTILTVFAIITGLVMDAVINFSLAVPYTPANPAAAGTVIEIAWSVMRDLANIGLVFVLIAIAISTILELGTERWRKLLIPFIGIALLINFTPVITGFIIDITNILTKIFFDAGGAGGGWKLFLPAFSTLGSIWKDSIGSIFSGDISTAFSTFAQAIVDVFFHILSITAFISMSLLILARILALWILVIISPIAFVAYILPETNRYFKQWWSNFFQWAILPIPLGIFYWLAARFVASGKSLCTSFSFTNPTDIGGSYSSIADPSKLTILQNAHMCEAIMLMFAIGTLFIGFMISFSFSAMGSGLVLKNTQRLGNWASSRGKKLGAFSARRAGRLGVRGGTRVAGAGLAAIKATPSAIKAIPGTTKAIPGAVKGAIKSGRELAEQGYLVAKDPYLRKLAAEATKRNITGAVKGAKEIAKAAPGAIVGTVLTPEEQRQAREGVLRTLGQAQSAEVKKEYEAIKKGKYTEDQLRQFMRAGSDAQRRAAEVILNSSTANFGKLSDADKQRLYKQAKGAGLENDLLLQNNTEGNLKLLIPDEVQRRKKGGELKVLMAKEVQQARKGMTPLTIEDLKNIINGNGNASERIAAAHQLADKKEYHTIDPAIQKSLLDLARANDQEVFILQRYLTHADASLGEIEKTLKTMKKEDFAKMHGDIMKPEFHDSHFMPMYRSANMSPEKFTAMIKDPSLRQGIIDKTQNDSNMRDLASNTAIDRSMRKAKKSRSPFAIDTWGTEDEDQSNNAGSSPSGPQAPPSNPGRQRSPNRQNISSTAPTAPSATTATQNLTATQSNTDILSSAPARIKTYLKVNGGDALTITPPSQINPTQLPDYAYALEYALDNLSFAPGQKQVFQNILNAVNKQLESYRDGPQTIS